MFRKLIATGVSINLHVDGISQLHVIALTYRSKLISPHEISCLLRFTDSKPPRKLIAIPLVPGIVTIFERRPFEVFNNGPQKNDVESKLE